ncbi:MAG: cytochrome c biogenesis protein CcsA [Pseudomonadota bacterium]
MFVFTILATYLGAGLLLLASPAPETDGKPRPSAAMRDRVLTSLLTLIIVLHGASLAHDVLLNVDHGFGFADVVNVIAWLFAAIGLYAALQQGFRAVAGVVLAIAGILVAICLTIETGTGAPLTWQLKLHAVLSLLAYSFLASGAVLAMASLVQDSQLRAAKVNRLSSVLPPLMATEQFLATLTTAGFVFLLMAITSGFVFVEDLFTQHLTHKSALSLGALVIFGLLVVGRRAAGWRGRRMLHLYLAGFAVLVLAYFGSKIVLEVMLDKQWG